MRRFATLAILAALALSAPAALARGGITPVSPKTGDRVPAGGAATFRMNVTGPGKVFVRVCKNKRTDGEGVICNSEATGKARRKRGPRREYKARFHNFPRFWLNNPGTYYWQAYRISCEDGIDDCKIEGPVVKFKVA